MARARPVAARVSYPGLPRTVLTFGAYGHPSQHSAQIGPLTARWASSLSMKEGLVSSVGFGVLGPRVGSRVCERGAHLSIASSRRRARASTRLDGNVASVAQLGEGRLCGQREGGAFRSEGLVAGEHVPDRLGEGAGELDLGDLGAALTADALLGLLVALAIERVL